MRKSLGSKLDIARRGEHLAERFLISRGYQILARNYITPFGEIDLIAKNKNCAVFVEVKTRTSEKYGPPLESITGVKKKHIIRNCEYFLKVSGMNDAECRIDAVSINLDARGNIMLLKHIRGAIIRE